MPQAVKLTSKTKMIVANKTDLPIKDVEAMIEVATSARKNHGDCYLVFDYPTPDGQSIPWATMHREYFEKHFEFAEPENDSKFVQLNTLAPTTH